MSASSASAASDFLEPWGVESCSAAHLHCRAADTVEDEEDVVQGNRADQIKKEPSSHVCSRDQLGVEDNLLTVISLHDPCKRYKLTMFQAKAKNLF